MHRPNATRHPPRAPWRIAPLCALLLSCAPSPRTELVIGLATDLAGPEVTDPLAQIQLTIWSPWDAEDYQIRRTWTQGLPVLPGSVSVHAPAGKAQSVRIELVGTTLRGERIVRTAMTGFVEGKSRFLRMMLAARCRPSALRMHGKDCAGTCIEGECRSPYIDEERLREYKQPAPDLEHRFECDSGTRPVSTETGQPVAVAGACASGSQCIESTCYKCTNPACTSHCGNKLKDGDESDVDCGGQDCDSCTIDGRCAGDTDCRSLHCEGNLCRPAAGRCANGRLDEGETDLDCGGLCGPCSAGRACLSAVDCAAGGGGGALECTSPPPDAGGASRCGPPTCNDGIRNGDETETDCGGHCLPCAPKDAGAGAAADMAR